MEKNTGLGTGEILERCATVGENAVSVESSAARQVVETKEKQFILVVDDSRVMRLALKRILKQEYSVIEAVNGEDAWAKLTADPSIRVVFSDLSMPELDGFGLLERIRGSDESRIAKTPFIVITGNEDDEGVRKQALSCGANDFIVKPFQSAEILTRAENYTAQTPATEDVPSPAQPVSETAASDTVAPTSMATPAEARLPQDSDAPATPESGHADLVEAIAARQRAEEELERFKGEAETLQREMEAKAAARLRDATAAREDAEKQLEDLRVRLEEEGLRLHAATKSREQAEKAYAVLKAEAEELQQEVARQAAQLDKDVQARRAAEQELARIKLQEVARREAEQKAAAEAEKKRRSGLFGFLRTVFGSGKGAAKG